jgi:hypothetical protein
MTIRDPTVLCFEISVIVSLKSALLFRGSQGYHLTDSVNLLNLA